MRRNEVAQLFLAHNHELHRFVSRKLDCTDAAAEITQEAFLRLLERAPNDLHNPRAYLYRIALNIVADVRDLRRRNRSVSDEIAVRDASDDAPTAEHHVISREELLRLQQVIASLPPRQREVLELHKFAGLRYAEIAARLGISKNTVMVHMVRALARCRDALERD
ncbi:MAG: RNA polymerase sigma factor [Pseudomonadota bacterium]